MLMLRTMDASVQIGWVRVVGRKLGRCMDMDMEGEEVRRRGGSAGLDGCENGV